MCGLCSLFIDSSTYVLKMIAVRSTRGNNFDIAVEINTIAPIEIAFVICQDPGR